MKTYKIGLDIKRELTRAIEGINTGDSVLFCVTLTDGGEIYDFSGVNIIKLSARLGDYSMYTVETAESFRKVEPERGYLEFIIPQIFLNDEGMHQLQIALFEEDTKISTAKVNYFVDEEICGETVEADEGTLKTYDALMKNVSEKVINAENERAAAEEKREEEIERLRGMSVRAVSVEPEESAGAELTKEDNGYSLILSIPKGDKGDRGEQGIQGPKGDKGQDGENGVGIYGDGEHAVIINDYDCNKAIGDFSIASGSGTVAGIKGYYYSSIDFSGEKPVITLTKEQGVEPEVSFVVRYMPGDCFSINNGSKFYNCSTIYEVNRNKITVDELPFDEVVWGTDYDDNTFYVIHRPLDGHCSFGKYAIAEGDNSQALEKASHAEGRQTLAYGQYSHTEGRQTKAAYASHAEGYKSDASGFYSHAEGMTTEASGKNGSHAEGYHTTASGADGSHAEGSITKALGITSHAEGYNTTAEGNYSHAEGRQTKAAYASHAEGYKSDASGFYSHAEGMTTEASGKNGSHAEGYHTTASGADGSHAEGSITKALGITSHAEGYNTTAEGNYSHAEGVSTTASGTHGSHAEGHWTTASGLCSHVEGFHTESAGVYQHVQGKFNIIDTSNKYANIVGNGTDVDKRSNAHTLDWDGNAWYAGMVEAGRNTTDEDGDLVLVSKGYLKSFMEKMKAEIIKEITESLPAAEGVEF